MIMENHTVRKASIEDISDISKMMMKTHDEFPEYNSIRFSMKKTTETITAALQNENAVILVATMENKIVGLLMGVVAPYWFSDEMQAVELLLFVEKDKRATGCGNSLVQMFIKWAKTFDVFEISAGASSGISVEKATEFYKNNGFRYKGNIMKLEVK